MSPVSELKKLAYYLKDKPLNNRTMLVTLDTEAYPEGVFLVSENLYLAVIDVQDFAHNLVSILAKFDVPVITSDPETYRKLASSRISQIKHHFDLLLNNGLFAPETTSRPLSRRGRLGNQEYEDFVAALEDAPSDFFVNLQPLGRLRSVLSDKSIIDRNKIIDKIPSGTLVELSSGVRLFVAYRLQEKYYLTVEKNTLGRSSTGRGYGRGELRIVYD